MTDNKEEADLENVLIGLSKCEQEMDIAEKDAEIYRLKRTSKIYLKRSELITQIPKFWYIVLAQNEDFSDYIVPDDLKFLEAIQDIYVEHLLKKDRVESENPRDFAITFKFNAFDLDTKEQEVTKFFETIIVDDGEEHLISHPVEISWPTEYKKINPSLIKDKTTKEGKANYRAGMKTFFAWFKWTGNKPGKEFRQGEELARLISDEIFPYAVKFYTEAMPGLGDDGEESSEELDLSDDDDEDDDDEDGVDEDTEEKDGKRKADAGEEKDLKRRK